MSTQRNETAAELLVLEACELGGEAIKIALKANGLALDDPQRWPLSKRMLAINHRLKEITNEVLTHENRTVQERSI